MTPAKKAAKDDAPKDDAEPVEDAPPESVKISKAQQAGLPRWPEQPGVPPPE